MVIYRRRCKHCKIRYNYQASGEGCFENFNDGTYCPLCAKAIKDALDAVPVVRERVLMDPPFADEITLDMLKKWHEEDEKKKQKEAKSNHGMHFRRCYPGLIDTTGKLGTNEILTVKGRDKWEGLTFHVSYWTKTNERNNIKVYMEVDMATRNVLGPWEHSDC